MKGTREMKHDLFESRETPCWTWANDVQVRGGRSHKGRNKNANMICYPGEVEAQKTILGRS